MTKLPLSRRLAAALLLVGLADVGSAAPPRPFVPVYETDFPDPFIIEHKGEYLAYATNSGGTNLPMASSRDLITWTTVRDPDRPGKRLDAMPVLAPWVEAGRTWAPEVIKLGGRWLLYYTARHKKRNTQCVGVAAAADPRGPFRDNSAEPLVCDYEGGGTIDAHPFHDTDGQLYLYHKSDSNSIRKPTTPIWGQRLSPDGMSVVGKPVSLLLNDRPWEAHVIESPTMVRTARGYTMLFSANHFGWEPHQRLSPYAMGYATCATPLGPCTDAPENPILHSYNDRKAGCLSGPGHQAVFQARGRSYIAFHAWGATAGCRTANKGRYMYIAPLSWTAAGKPVIAPSLRPKGK
ncbi:MAG: glycoside hydrolase family 43 protein [Pseudomonadota bacterium]|nr:glycoside hydrolase family 43 protein [Pseudomonadota bacterium]